MSARQCSARQRGVTLIELVVFIIIVSVGLAGVLSVLTLTVGKSSDPLIIKQAMAIADGMMEEILLKDFCDPDLVPPTCTASVEASRDLYDNVGDYDGYGPKPIYSPADLATELVPGYTVSVVAKPSTVAVHGVPAASIIKVVVSVNYSAGTFQLTGYRINYDAP